MKGGIALCVPRNSRSRRFGEKIPKTAKSVEFTQRTEERVEQGRGTIEKGGKSARRERMATGQLLGEGDVQSPRPFAR